MTGRTDISPFGGGKELNHALGDGAEMKQSSNAASLSPKRVMVVGLGASGRAVLSRLLSEHREVVVIDDSLQSSIVEAMPSKGVEVYVHPTPEELSTALEGVSEIVVSPGVPPRHPLFDLLNKVDSQPEVISELEFAYRRSNVPILAVTGSNGKTTVTTLIDEMLRASGIASLAAGNIGYPATSAVAESSTFDWLVCEVSSFQLYFTRSFRPAIAVWLNVTADHLDWHTDMDEYVAAKARVWANQGTSDVAVANTDDPVVMAHLPRGKGRCVTFGLTEGDYHVDEGFLVGPGRRRIVAIEDLKRGFPHDLSNALAATAAAVEAGASLSAAREVLIHFEGLPHRLQLVGVVDGVEYLDDSKATTPSAVLAALQGLDSVVLIAGGRNKGLDMGVLAEGASKLRAVVAIGEAAPEVCQALSTIQCIGHAQNMKEAVELAKHFARPGDKVLLSPGCASYDWYSSYAERGDDFARCVRSHMTTNKGGVRGRS